jgi:hypothetical protein
MYGSSILANLLRVSVSSETEARRLAQAWAQAAREGSADCVTDVPQIIAC